MTTVKLSRRLSAAADAVRAGAVVADVGCDHGQLAAALLQSGRAAFVFATDIHPLPLQKATLLLEQLGLAGHSQTLLCNGLSGLPAGAADDIVIAGLGYDTIAEIIGDAPWLCDPEKRLVLVPASHHARLRVFLCGAGFEIQRETAVYEGGHCYTVMTAQFAAHSYAPDAIFAALGKIQSGTPDANEYIARQYRRVRRLLESGADGQKRADAALLARHIEEMNT